MVRVVLTDSEKRRVGGTAEEAEQPQGDFRAGLRSGVSQLTEQTTGEVGVGLGRVLGSERLEQAGERRVEQGQQTQQEAATGRITQPTDVRLDQGVGTALGDAADVFQFTVGQQLPRVGAVAAAGGAGALAGRRVAGTPGAIAGGVLGALGVNLPSSFAEARSEQREVGVDDPGAALRTGATAASVETFSDVALFGANRLLRLAGFNPANRLQAVLAAAGANIPVQAGTELAQEEILLRERERIDPEFDLGGEEAFTRRLNAAILGAVLGPTFAGGVAALQRPGGAQPTVDDADEGISLPPGADVTPVTTPVDQGVATPVAASPDPAVIDTVVQGTPAPTTQEVAASPEQSQLDAVLPATQPGVEPVQPTDQELAAALTIPATPEAEVTAPVVSTPSPAAPPTTAPAQVEGRTVTAQPNLTPVDDIAATDVAAQVTPTQDTAQVNSAEITAQDSPESNATPDTQTPVRVPDPAAPEVVATQAEPAPVDAEALVWPSPQGQRRVRGVLPTGDLLVENDAGEATSVPRDQLEATIRADMENAATSAPVPSPGVDVVADAVDASVAQAPQAAAAVEGAVPADAPSTVEALDDAASDPPATPPGLSVTDVPGTPRFDQFFAGSRIVDEQSQPRVVYHATSGDFTQFDTDGAYFTATPELANDVAQLRSREPGSTPNIMPVYVAAKNPAVLDVQVVEALGRDAEAVAALREQGFDSAMTADMSEIFVFNPRGSVKSAVGNTGAFDPQNPDIRFAAAEQAPTGTTAQQVQEQVTAVTATWADAPPINVVQGTADLPPQIAQYAADAGVVPAGVFWRGEAYLVADNISGPEGVRTIIAHEVLGHGGVRAMFGAQFPAFANRMVRDLRGNKHFQAFVSANGFDLSTPGERITAADEYLAHIAQRIDGGNATERMRTTWQRLVAWVNDQLRALGFPVKLSSADLTTLMVTARSRIIDGESGAARPTIVVQDDDGTDVMPPSFMARGEAAKRALDGFMKPIKNIDDPKRVLRSVASDILPAVLKMTSRADLVRNFAPMFQSGPVNLLSNWTNLDREQSAFTDGRMVGADEVFQKTFRMKKGERQKMHATMEFATLRGLKAGEPVKKQPWTTEQWEAEGNLGRYGDLEKAVSDLNAQWESMAPETRQVYIEMVRPGNTNSMRTMFEDIVQALEANIIDSMEAGEARDAALNNVRSIRRSLKGDYIPLSRFGDYVVVGYEPDENGVLQRVSRNHFGSATQAEHFKQKLERKGVVARDFTMAKFLEQTDGVGNAGFISDFERALRQKLLGGLDPEIDSDTIAASQEYINNVMDITRQFYYEQQPDGSILKHQMHREGIAGYEDDFSRSYAEYMMKHSRVLGDLRFGIRKGEVLRDMRQYLNELNSGEAQRPENFDGVRAGIVYNSVVERERVLRTTKTAPIVQALNKYTFFQMLTSPAQYVIQTSQVPMFWVPTIAARKGIGVTRAASEMLSAIRSITTGQLGINKIQSKEMDALVERLFKKVTPENRDEHPNRRVWDNILTDEQLSQEIESLPVTTQELLALRIEADRGVLDITRSHDLQRGASDNFGIATTDTGRLLNKIVDASGFIMRHSELTNRRVSILGTLRINRSNGMRFMDAVKDAEEVTLQTQFDYSRANKAPWLTNDWMKVFTQIQSFRFHALGFMATEFNRAFISNAVSDAERAQAKRVLGWQMVMTSMYAGAIGTPLGAGLVAATNALMSTDDEPYDAVHEADLVFRQLGAGGETLSHLAFRGAPAAAGIDISKRTELASLFTASAFDAPEGVTGNRYTQWLAAQLLGPTWSNISNIITGGDALRNGDTLEGLIKLSPAIARDTLRLTQAATDGVRGGNKMMLLSPDQLTATDYMIMAVGLQPTRLQEMKDTDRAILERNTVLSQRRSKVISDYQTALENNDAEGLDEAEEALYAFNRRQPVFSIGKSDIRSVVKRKLRQDMGIQGERYTQVAEQYGFRYKPLEGNQ